MGLVASGRGSTARPVNRMLEDISVNQHFGSVMSVLHSRGKRYGLAALGTCVLLIACWVWPRPLLVLEIHFFEAAGMPISVTWNELVANTRLYEGHIVRFRSDVSFDRAGMTLIGNSATPKQEDLIDATVDPHDTDQTTISWVTKEREMGMTLAKPLIVSANFTGTFRTGGLGCFLPRNRLEVLRTGNCADCATKIIPAL